MSCSPRAGPCPVGCRAAPLGPLSSPALYAGPSVGSAPRARVGAEGENRLLATCTGCKEVLLPTRSEERGILGIGSIPVAKLPSCHNMKI